MGSPDVDLIKLDSFDVAHVQSLYDFQHTSQTNKGPSASKCECVPDESY